MTGFHDIDQYVQSQLLVAALDICLKTITVGGTFISKVFKGHDTTFLTSQFKTFFKQVDIVKPKSSRASSVENFIVCRFFDPPKEFSLSKLTTFSAYSPEFIVQKGDKEHQKVNETIFRFVTCGDLSTFDEIEEEESEKEEEMSEN